MKRFNLFLFSMCIALGSLFTLMTSCCDSETLTTAGDGDTEKPETPGGEEPVIIEMKDGQLNGVVYNTTGAPVQGVSVTSGTSTAITDGNGLFSFDKVQVANGRTVVKFHKDRYFDVVRSFDFANTDNWQVVMVQQGNSGNTAQETYPSSADKEFNLNGAKVKLPGGQYVDVNGNPYTGNVTTDVLYLDPDDKNFSDMMPGGDLAAKSNDGSNDVDQLISYGMVSVNLKGTEGNELKLKDGTPATITITPGNGSNLDIPAWVFNPSTGLWDPAGNTQRQGNSYVITVSNVSWVNLDYPSKRCYMQGTVKDESGAAVQNQRVHVGQVYTFTNSTGFYSTYVPINTGMKVRVESADYSNYSPVAEKIVLSGTAGSRTTCDLTLPKLNKVTGKIISHRAPNMRYSVWMTYDSKMSTRNELSDNNGNFSIKTPYGYTGTAALNIRTYNGSVFTKNIEITNEDIELGSIVIDEATTAETDRGYMIIKYGENSYDEITLNKIPEFWNFDKYGCTVFEDSLVIKSNIKIEGHYEYWTISIPNYSADVTQYNNATLNYTQEIDNIYRKVTCENVMITVQQDMNKIKLSLAGDAVSYYCRSHNTTTGEQVTIENNNAIIENSNLEFNIDFRSTKKTFIYKDELPDFAAFLGDQSCYSAVITGKNAFCDRDIIIEHRTSNDAANEYTKSLINLIKAAGFVNADANKEEFNNQDLYFSKYSSGNNVILIHKYYGLIKVEIIENLNKDMEGVRI